jgi:sigma-B regulation protein RsbU (phosphoserine phosphatase)
VSELYSTGSLPIGLVGEVSYTSSTIQLEAGDTLLLYTDGVTEAEDQDRNLFEDGQLKEVFSQHQDSSLETLKNGILNAVEKFTCGASQSDDVTLLVVRYRGPAESASKNP